MRDYANNNAIKNYEVREDFNTALNIGFSSNYICLRVLDQESKFEQPEKSVYSREDIFNKSPSENWISHKLKAMASLRNNNIEALINGMNENDKDYLSFIEMLECAKKTFISNYNNYTGKNLKFKEVIDGYNFFDKDFEEVAKICILMPAITISDPDMQNLLTSYLSYLDIYEKVSILKSYIDISQCIADSVNTDGRKTYYYDHPRSPLIKKLSSEEIEDYIKITAALFDDQETELKYYHSALTDAYRVGARKSTDMYYAAQRVNDLTARVSVIGAKTAFANEAFRLAIELEKRLEGANKDITTNYSRFTEKMYDLFQGVSTLGEEKFEINDIYVHQYELDFINFVFNLLDTSPSQIKAEHNDKEFSRAIAKSRQRIAKEDLENKNAKNNKNKNEKNSNNNPQKGE